MKTTGKWGGGRAPRAEWDSLILSPALLLKKYGNDLYKIDVLFFFFFS